VTLLIGVAAISVPGRAHAIPGPATSDIAGDANCDHTTDEFDALAIFQRASLASAPASASPQIIASQCFGVANVLCDDALTVADGLAILRWKAGLDPELPERCAPIGIAPIASNVSFGSGTIYATYNFDFDAGVMQQVAGDDPTMDIWWEIVSDTERWLVPIHDAKVAELPGADFDSVNLTQLIETPYSEDAIHSDVGNDHLTPGSVIAVMTTNGNYTKVRITSVQPEPDNTLQFDWNTQGIATQ
jgi:hypothetical protein